ncbi:DNA-binding CsgD family transcriptional regulator [Rhodoblastus acidophilus]|uniref:helix-turn-helix transcriptional regulator n=1 Tax=Rhodoblastus acidophilus TaxID=1074 RepID=UPI0022258F9B|nr:helix-turn-helix transcriptional regulator [Rhodoblastus acidophilus]MCW2285509.1 DNA-binding CsgD family transcriptional regulator [Rhodoblastus acidophilus]MCW2334407.1 DNA-binding CsgD family transcriptional regulator [Rhodoblastus acidophilus]
MLPSLGLAEPYQDIRSRRTPPYSSKVLILNSNAKGFVSDGHARIRERLERERFFREYMKPIADVPYRASASLLGPRDSTGLKLSFWRGDKEGAFDARDVERLNSVLPSIRSSAQLAVFGLGQQAREQSVLFRRRGEFMFDIDFAGRPTEAGAQDIVAHGDPLSILRGRLVCAMAAEQRQLEAVIARAVAPDPVAGATRLTRRRDGAPFFLMVTPIRGDAVDVMAPVAAIGVLIDPSRKSQLDPAILQRVQMAAGLTDRETTVAGLISAGLSIAAIADHVGVSPGTARNHLKAAMQKCGVHSQVELAAFVSRFEG